MRHFGPALLALALGCGAAAAADQDKQQMLRQCAGPNTDDCIVRQFKDTPQASLIRGRVVFQDYCALCHGLEGRGDGRTARIHTPPPANLVASRSPTEYLNLIIRRGGEALGRSKGMPAWGEQLTDEQTRDVVNHLISIRR